MTSMQAVLDRRQVVAALLAKRGDCVVVTGLGSPTYDVHSCGDSPANFYLWGAMGGAALVGLGLAVARPEQHVLVITGDGEQLMGMGGLATIGVRKPGNLSIVVIDNGHFGETGMQSSHTSRGVDLAAVARSCGFIRTETVADAEQLGALCEELQRTSAGPRLFVVKVHAGNYPRSLAPRDAVLLKNRFRDHLASAG